MVHKGPGMLSDEVRSVLKLEACELYRAQLERKLFSNEAAEGLIETAWKSHSVGTRAGILFRAQVECGDGDYRVNFLLSLEDLEHGADILRELIESGEGEWVENTEPFPVSELYRFYDLHSRASRTMH